MLTTREREILLKVVMEFYGWLEPPNTISSKTERPEISESTTEIKTDTNSASPPQSEEQLEISQQEQDKLKEGRLTPVNFLSRVFSSEIPVPDSSSASMVAQVDGILQEKLRAENMQQWAVRLTESPDKYIVLVGLERYEAIDDVPYERVRSMIRASVAEWEQRSEESDTVL